MDPDGISTVLEDAPSPTAPVRRYDEDNDDDEEDDDENNSDSDSSSSSSDGSLDATEMVSLIEAYQKMKKKKKK